MTQTKTKSQKQKMTLPEKAVAIFKRPAKNRRR